MTFHAKYSSYFQQYVVEVVFDESEYNQIPHHYVNLVTSGPTLREAFKELAHKCYRLWHHFNTYDKVQVDILRKARRDIYIRFM